MSLYWSVNAALRQNNENTVDKILNLPFDLYIGSFRKTRGNQMDILRFKRLYPDVSDAKWVCHIKHMILIRSALACILDLMESQQKSSTTNFAPNSENNIFFSSDCVFPLRICIYPATILKNMNYTCTGENEREATLKWN